MTERQQRAVFIKSLYIVPRHVCCITAWQRLFPPRKEGQTEFVHCKAISYWYIDIGDGGPLVEVTFCPFCGEKLEEVQ